MTSLVSADIIIKEQPRELYNLGEIVHVPTKIFTSSGVENFFLMKLICNGVESEIHRQYISLAAGAEMEINSAIPLTTQFIGRSNGLCTIKAIIGDIYVLTNEFRISNWIDVKIETEKTEFKPKESLIVEGTAKKENGENVNGFIDLLMPGTDIEAKDTIQNGYFLVNLTLPKDIAAGQYLTQLNIYEKDAQGNISNTGFVDYNVLIVQVPTSLEIVFGDSKVIPGEDLNVKGVLHDQTGEKIESDVTLSLINEDGKIMEQKDLASDEYLEYPIEYNQAPLEWEVIAVAGELETNEVFNISEKEYAEIDLINKTVIITNKGNVPYNETVIVRIGEEIVNFDSYVGVNEVKKYSLSAPEGEYIVQIEAGKNKFNQTVMLTGNAIRIKEIGPGILQSVRYPFVWIFIIGILGFMTYIVYKKGYQRAFIGYIQKRRAKKVEAKVDQAMTDNTSSRNKAELSLSIKGDKQDISLICLKLKNKKDTINNESIQNKIAELIKIAEQEKAVTYNNQENLFFLFVPVKTKTFKNQATAAKVARELKASIEKYNKMAKEKINFGLSLNYGTIVAKEEKDSLKFMSMGTLITSAKKLAGLSEGEVYLTKDMNEKLLTEAKTEKHQKNGVEVFMIKEMRVKGEHNKKFLNDFVKKLEKKD
jgi:hypothetical protein